MVFTQSAMLPVRHVLRTKHRMKELFVLKELRVNIHTLLIMKIFPDVHIVSRKLPVLE